MKIIFFNNGLMCLKKFSFYLFKFLSFLVIFISCPLAAEIDTVIIKSEAMSKKPKAVVVLPDSYFDSGSKFPVVYLLHGWSGSYRDWANHTDLGIFADRYEFIIVCPDGGYAGWYIDSPFRQDSQYESYISSEVVEYIDSNYRTISNMESRFICGLSMGGHGALSLLAKHPDIFSAAGSMSGVMKLTDSNVRYGIAELMGEFEQNRELWEQNSCINLVESLQNLGKGVVIECGTDDRLIEGNREIHQKLLNMKIEHDYYERPGDHTWSYWVNALEYHFLFFSRFYRQNG